MRLDTARRFALSLPETTEEPHFDMPSIDEDPVAFEAIRWGKQDKVDWLRVHLAAAERTQVCELLEDAWRSKAPKRVLAAFDADREAPR